MTNEIMTAEDFQSSVTKKSVTSDKKKINQRKEALKELKTEKDSLLLQAEEMQLFTTENSIIARNLLKTFSQNSIKSYQQLKAYSNDTDAMLSDLFALADAINALKECDNVMQKIALISAIE